MDSQDLQDTQRKIASILCIFCENATRDAVRVAAHHGGADVDAADIIRSLMLQAVPSSEFFEQPDLALHAQRHYDALGGDQENDPEDDGTPHVPSLVPIEELVSRMASATDMFQAWVPETDEGICLKRAIESTAKEFDS